MKGLHVLVMAIVWGFILVVHVRSESPTFCDAKERAFNDTRMCFSHPYDCTEDGKVPCQMTLTVRITRDEKFNFSLTGKLDVNETTGWIALGLSTDRKMGDDDVMMCIVDGNGTVTLHHRFNEGRTNRPETTEILSLLEPTSSTYVDDVITCNFHRTYQDNPPYHDFDLLIPRTWYLLFGMGPTNSSGSPIKHTTTPYISDERIDFTFKYRITIWESLEQANSPHDYMPDVKEKYDYYKNSAVSPTLGFMFMFSLIQWIITTMLRKIV